jgi:hypothetical protein
LDVGSERIQELSPAHSLKKLVQIAVILLIK